MDGDATIEKAEDKISIAEELAERDIELMDLDPQLRQTLKENPQARKDFQQLHLKDPNVQHFNTETQKEVVWPCGPPTLDKAENEIKEAMIQYHSGTVLKLSGFVPGMPWILCEHHSWALLQPDEAGDGRHQAERKWSVDLSLDLEMWMLFSHCWVESQAASCCTHRPASLWPAQSCYFGVPSRWLLSFQFNGNAKIPPPVNIPHSKKTLNTILWPFYASKSIGLTNPIMLKGCKDGLWPPRAHVFSSRRAVVSVFSDKKIRRGRERSRSPSRAKSTPGTGICGKERIFTKAGNGSSFSCHGRSFWKWVNVYHFMQRAGQEWDCLASMHTHTLSTSSWPLHLCYKVAMLGCSLFGFVV